MFYWSRTGSLADVLALLALTAFWALGGWLIVRHVFHLRSTERLVAGTATGFILFISLSNLLAHFIRATGAFWGGSALVLVVGLAAGLLSKKRPWLDIPDLHGWPSLTAVVLICGVFTLILRGLAIFDDHYHLPLVSTMAAGNIPPRFPMDPTLHLAYHYGLHIFAACAMRIGGFFPWSAWDLARALAIAFSVGLSWLWVHRMTRNRAAAYAGAMLMLLGGGARWLLVFLPPRILDLLGSTLDLQTSAVNTGPTLAVELVRPWRVGGAGPIPYPFAFANGVFEPLSMAFGASGALPAMTILLLLLLVTRRRAGWLGWLTLGVLFGSLGLSAEHFLVTAMLGMVLVLGAHLIVQWKAKPFISRHIRKQWLVVLGAAVILGAFQGGFLTVVGEDLVARLLGRPYPVVQTDYQGFSISWPPIIFSGHFGPLSLFDGRQLAILLAEVGPALALGPIAVAILVRRRYKQDLLPQGLMVASIFSFLAPTVLRYGLEFDITRMTSAALWLWVVLTFPGLWYWWRRATPAAQTVGGLAYGITVFGGCVLLGISLLAVGTPTLTTFVRPGEQKLARLYWDRLDPNAQILDSIPERSVTLFGRASRALKDVYHYSPEWKNLIADPDPAKVAQAGYSYIYLDRGWADSIKGTQGNLLDNPCIRVVDSLSYDWGDYRYLLDVRGCR